MPTRLPDSIDPRRLARPGTTLQGELATGSMARLAARIGGAEPAVVALRFSIDEEGIPRIVGEARVAGRAQCQRCLEAMPIALHAVIRLVVHRPSDCVGEGGRGRGAQSAPGFEALEIEDGPLSLAGLVEDELVLAMPEYPVHERCEPDGGMWATDDTEIERASPFAVLRGLKQG